MIMIRTLTILAQLFLFASVAGAQQEFDSSQESTAAIQTVRIERAKLKNKSGKLSAEARRLFTTLSYDKNGNLESSTVYKDNGSIYSKYISKRDSNNRKIEETYYDAKDSVLDRTVYKYDSSGLLVEKLYYGEKNSPEGTSALKYDSAGRVVEKSRYDAKGTITNKTLYSYFDAERKVDIITFDGKSGLTVREVKTYDAGGRISEQAGYTWNNVRSRLTTYRYDGRGNLIEAAFYNADKPGKMIYVYEFDSNGNWIKQTMTSTSMMKNGETLETTDITYREITYSTSGKAHQPRKASISDTVLRSETKSLLRGTAIKRSEATYPREASMMRVGGKVTVQVLIGEDGEVLTARLASGPPVFSEASESTARRWKFSPTLYGGVPTQAWGTLDYNFVPPLPLNIR